MSSLPSPAIHSSQGKGSKTGDGTRSSEKSYLSPGTLGQRNAQMQPKVVDFGCGRDAYSSTSRSYDPFYDVSTKAQPNLADLSRRGASLANPQGSRSDCPPPYTSDRQYFPSNGYTGIESSAYGDQYAACPVPNFSRPLYSNTREHQRVTTRPRHHYANIETNQLSSAQAKRPIHSSPILHQVLTCTTAQVLLLAAPTYSTIMVHPATASRHSRHCGEKLRTTHSSQHLDLHHPDVATIIEVRKTQLLAWWM